MTAPRILVVDDEPDTLVYVSALLEDSGYEVRTAASSAGALAALQEFAADVVLIDVLMPGRSGLDLLVTLRKSERWAGLRLVVMTGMDQILKDDCQSYLGSHHGVRGPDAVLGKPLDPAALMSVLTTLTRAHPHPAAPLAIQQ